MDLGPAKNQPRLLNIINRLAELPILSKHCQRVNKGLLGGVPASQPIWGAYVPYALPNWGAKFLADALQLKSTLPAAQPKPNP